MMTKSFCGSYAYLAPEMIRKKGHTKALDWYLLGVLLYELLEGIPPFYDNDKDTLFKNIINDSLILSDDLSDDVVDLLERLLCKDPVFRLGTSDPKFIKSHAWFKDVDWEVVRKGELEMPTPYLLTNKNTEAEIQKR